MAPRLNYIDLFAGAGGLSEGFIRAGFEPVAHVEIDKAASFTLKTRLAYHYLKTQNRLDEYVEYLKGNISRNELYSKVPDSELKSVINTEIGYDNQNTFQQIDSILNGRDVDLIIGGPPCQAYSLAGRSRNRGMTHDNRNYLYIFYGRFLERYKPKFFVFENVLGLLSADKGGYFKDIIAYFGRIGYNIDYRKLDSKDFGVLQSRKRVIVIGWHNSIKKFKYPEFETINHGFKVNNIFSDLPKIKAGEGLDKNGYYKKQSNDYLNKNHIRNGIEVLTQHVARPNIERDKEIYSIAVKKWKNGTRLLYTDLPANLKTHKNQSGFLTRFKVVEDDKSYSQTVVAHVNRDGHYYIHPDEKQNRSLSIRELARLQSFPDDYYFEGIDEKKNRTPALKQVGNAVPPLMAEKIAKGIKSLILYGNI